MNVLTIKSNDKLLVIVDAAFYSSDTCRILAEKLKKLNNNIELISLPNADTLNIILQNYSNN